ncbi:MAG: 50S ribosomal protein L17 [Candidatus Buchananbacteria bacterium]|nr:50S ribosomal protein L17 [Candidatus Buchananbacteria bacterium]
MRHRKKGKILDRKAAPRKALMRNLATSLVVYEKIKTTTAKAKALKPMVEKLITVSKVNNLTTKRKLTETLTHQKAVKKALEVLGPRYQDRKGGYLRITKIGPRPGDGADVSVIEFV